MKGKSIVKSILIGLLLGLLLCGVAYGILALVFKKPQSALTSGKSVEVADKEYEPLDDSKYNITSNEKLVAELTAADVLIPSKSEELFTIQVPTIEIDVVQGGCTDGTYFYQAFYGEDLKDDQYANQCIIVKYDITKGKVVATSEVMQLNHVNDMTINTKLGYLVVCHNAPLNNLITYVDMETLELVDTFAIEQFMFCIDYNEARDQYVVGLTGTKSFRILDADFNAVSEIIQPAKPYKSATTQGAACDDDYIYFVYYNTNVINVYDWEGNFVSSIELETVIPYDYYEPESITPIDGEFYVFCGQGEATIFKISDFVPKPEEVTE